MVAAGRRRSRRHARGPWSSGLNDQHCHMNVPADSPLAVGDMVALRHLAPLPDLRQMAGDLRRRRRLQRGLRRQNVLLNRRYFRADRRLEWLCCGPSVVGSSTCVLQISKYCVKIKRGWLLTRCLVFPSWPYQVPYVDGEIDRRPEMNGLNLPYILVRRTVGPVWYVPFRIKLGCQVQAALDDIEALIDASHRTGNGLIGRVRLGVRLPPIGEPLRGMLVSVRKHVESC